MEQMDDETYAQYVRGKMWERSWEGVEKLRAEKRRQKIKENAKSERERERRRRGWEKKAEPRSAFTFGKEVEESLRRGEERRIGRRWKKLWEGYLKEWDVLQESVRPQKDTGNPESKKSHLQNEIAWPVESGKLKDVVPQEVERFVLEGVRHASQASEREAALLRALKIERVRWHPDKIQQRYGSMGVDERIMQGATAVFQVVDRMWTEQREKR